ncbi:MAG: hypothetical protein KatS3mg109_2073 [Pirellulaceae bacterium]|nr:MAG: hypothetical protein KatS3mg109_2073 [Pirellulaceae bacterium]
MMDVSILGSARTEVVERILGWLGSLAAVADAERVFAELRERRLIIHDGRHFVETPELANMADDEFWAIVDAAVESGDQYS